MGNKKIQIFNNQIVEFTQALNSKKKFSVKSTNEMAFITENFLKYKSDILSCKKEIFKNLLILKGISIEESFYDANKLTIWKYIHLLFLTAVKNKVSEDDLKEFVELISQSNTKLSIPALNESNMEIIKQSMESDDNNELMSFVKTISKDMMGILSEKGITNPEDLLKGGGFADIMSAVTQKIHAKISEGGLDEEKIKDQASKLLANLV